MKAKHSVGQLRRSDLPSLIQRVIHEGKGYQSSVFLIEIDGQLLAVKDFSDTPLLFRRFIAPFLVRREMRALRHLDGTPGVPRLFGRMGRYAFIMDYVEGTPIADFEPGELDPAVFPRVQKVIDEIHRRGVSHGDLKRRSNLLVTSEGEVFLIDFAASVIGRWPWSRWFQKQVALVDDKSLPRIKKFAAPELMTEDDWHKLNNPTGLEKWVRRLLNR